jgi:ABC-type phosphate transport system auxiliary subunit
MKILIPLILTGVLFSAKAETYNMEQPINVSGDFQSEMSKRKMIRKKLEKKTITMLKKQIELQRLRQELQLQKQLEKKLSETI